MTEDEWCKACRDAAERHERLKPDGPETLREELAELDNLMRSAPWTIRSRYPLLVEADLRDSAARHASGIEGGTLVWPHFPLGAQKALYALAIQIRSLDALLQASDTRYNRIPADPAREWRSRSGRAYVIPSRRRRDMGSKDGDKLGYGRRGTLLHRVIPATLGGMPVRPVTLAALDAAQTEIGPRLGAALFPGLDVVPKDTDRGFIVEKVQHVDLPGTIGRQIAGLSGAQVLVWPELTIDDGSLERIAADLARLALLGSEMPNVVVAGSWHRDAEGAIRNTAPILDGTGAWRAEYSKVAPFANEKGRWEDIGHGHELLVLVCDRFLASVAICKDYCDLGETTPWHLLDVDLLLVPSMGGSTTMDGHLHRSNQDRIQHDLRAFVVQQGAPKKKDDPKGFVLPAPRDVPRTADAVRFDEEWGSFDT